MGCLSPLWLPCSSRKLSAASLAACQPELVIGESQIPRSRVTGVARARFRFVCAFGSGSPKKRMGYEERKHVKESHGWVKLIATQCIYSTYIPQNKIFIRGKGWAI